MSRNDITQILTAIGQGELSASDELLPLVYDELRKLATARMAHENPGQTLQATSLVHEAYVRLVDVEQPQDWENRGHFFAAAAEAMRRILVERARQKASIKAGGFRIRVDLSESKVDASIPLPLGCHGDIIALDHALEKLEQVNPQTAELVKLRFFTGLTCEEAAQVLGVSTATAGRLWSYARSWLLVELSDHDSDDERN